MLQYSYRPQYPATSRTRTDVDQGWIDYLPITERPALIWPNRARIAVMICPNVLYYEFIPPADPWINSWSRMTPDVMMYGRQDFGNRVGFWRLVDILDQHELPCTAVLNVAALARFPDICSALVARKWDILGHGMYNTRFICGYSEDQERAYYREEYIRGALDAVERACGSRPHGWHGPEYGESERTPALLAELGVQYVLDWPNDEQPYLMNTPAGAIVSLPMALELDDVIIHYHRRVGLARWRQAVGEALDQLLSDGAAGGRHLALNLHPWLIGHPHRIGYLEEVLADVSKRGGVWLATTGEIAACCLAQHRSDGQSKLERGAMSDDCGDRGARLE
jgi:allantoinase